MLFKRYFKWFAVLTVFIMSLIAEQYLLADETDASCRLELIEIVPLTRDTDGPCTTECDGGDWYAEVKQENLSAVKQEPDDVCYIVYFAICVQVDKPLPRVNLRVHACITAPVFFIVLLQQTEHFKRSRYILRRPCRRCRPVISAADIWWPAPSGGRN